MKPAMLAEYTAFLEPLSTDPRVTTNDSRIVFQFLPEITLPSHSASYDAIGGDIIGRTDTMKLFKGGTVTEIKLSATFAAVDSVYNEEWVQKQVNKLVALTKPVYDREALWNRSRDFAPPPMCLLNYGYLFVNTPVVVSDVTPSIAGEVGIQPITNLPTVVTVEIALATNYPYGYLPGYLNYIQAWAQAGQVGTGALDARQLSQTGSPAIPVIEL